MRVIPFLITLGLLGIVQADTPQAATAVTAVTAQRNHAPARTAGPTSREVFTGAIFSGDVVVYEIPANVETYIPVTPVTIETDADEISSIRSGRGTRVLSLIRTSSQQVDKAKIRLKITAGADSYVFDSKGVGVSSKGEAVKVDLKDLRATLRSFEI